MRRAETADAAISRLKEFLPSLREEACAVCDLTPSRAQQVRTEILSELRATETGSKATPCDECGSDDHLDSCSRSWR
jgi:hypothetical protein